MKEDDYKTTNLVSLKLHPPKKVQMIAEMFHRIEKFADRYGIEMDTSSDVDITGN